MSALRRLAAVLFALSALVSFCGASFAQAAAEDDAFGVQIELPEKTIVYLSGSGTWDAAYETLVEAFRTVHEYIDRRGLKPDGDAMMIYTGADDTGFDFRAAVPVLGPFDNPPQGDIAVGVSPAALTTVPAAGIGVPSRARPVPLLTSAWAVKGSHSPFIICSRRCCTWSRIACVFR